MKNKYVGSIRDDFMALVEEKDLIRVRLDRIEQQNKEGRLSKEYYNQVVADTKKEYEEKANEFRNSLIDIKNKYAKNLDKWATLDSEKITADNKLLESGLPLTAEDYRKLEEKNSTNYTMLNLIRNHAKQRKVGYEQKIVIDKERKLKALDHILQDSREAERELSSGRMNYVSIRWRGEGTFDSVYAPQIQELDIQ